MNYLFHAGLSLLFLMFQTVLLPLFLPSIRFYDIFIPYVLYLSIFRPFFEGVFVILVTGLIVDSLSGAPFGLYGTTYLWLFMIVKWGANFFHAGNHLLLLLTVVTGVAMENLIFWGMVALQGRGELPAAAIRIALAQIVWAALTGTLVMIGIRWLQRQWTYLAELFSSRPES